MQVSFAWFERFSKLFFETRLGYGGASVRKSILRSALIVAALLLNAPAVGETIVARGDRFAQTVFESDDGLPHNTVQSLIQRRDGFIWIATLAGVVRFDGVTFLPITSPLLADAKSSATRSIIEENADSLVVACDTSGLVRLKGNEVSVHPAMQEPIGDRRINLLFREADDVFWILFNTSEVWRWNRGQLEKFPPLARKPPYIVGSLAITPQGKVYLARGEGIELYERGKLVPVPQIPAGPCSICLSNNGTIFVATADQVGLLDREVFTVLAEAVPWKSMGAPSVILQTRDGALWIGSRRVALQRWSAKQFESIPTSHPRVNDLMEDEDGSLWIATSGGGVNRLQRAAFTLFGEDAGIYPDIAGGSVCEVSPGVIWFANRNGIWQISDNTVQKLVAPGSWPEKAIPICPDSAGNVWGGDKTTIFRVTPGAEAPPLEYPSENPGRIHVIFPARDGSIWVGRETGPLTQFRNGEQTVFGSDEGFSGSGVQAIGEDSEGNLWIGCATGELFRFRDEQFTLFGPKDGLPASPIRAILGDSQVVWIGTGGGGLIALREKRFYRITEAQGLPNNTISQIVEDNSGSLWFGSNRGLFKVQKSQLLRLLSDTPAAKMDAINYGKSEGLAGFAATSNYQPMAWKSSSGRLWFASRKGLVSTDPSLQLSDRRPPRTYIEKLLVDGESLDPLAPQIRPGAKKIEIGYTAPSFRSADRVQFRYRMKGFDADWTYGGSQRFAVYPRLPPGRYLFEVTATSGDFVWNSTPTEIAFEVLPNWWDTWMAKVAIICAACGVAGGIVRYAAYRRLRARLAQAEQEKRIEVERTRIARNLHDGIGAGLTQVGMIAEDIHDDCADLKGIRGQSTELVNRVNALARDLDAAVWVVSPKHDRLTSLCAYICQFALEFFRNTSVRCFVHTEENIPDRIMSPELRHNLFMTAQEAMNNALKHSGATEVQLSIRMVGNLFELTLVDNGTGFDLEKASESQRAGLKNMRGRMGDIGGKLEITSSKRGTMVKIEMPLEKNSSSS